jgi:uncharacterized membrane protein YdbT with pleckstrin-like domain
MNPEQPTIQPNNTHVDNSLTVMQPGEQIIVKIKRHPIGLIYTYATIALLIAGVAYLGFGVVPSLAGAANETAVRNLAFAAVFVVSVLSLLFTLIVTKVYWGNTWTVTSDSVTQVEQNALFSRQSSQLSMEHIEDVTAEQHGILPHIFGYGVLKVETAGEHSKFHFIYCPNPNFYAQKILAAREAFMAHESAPHH